MYENNLPHQRTIRKWYESINGKPGCTSEALVALKIRTEAGAANGKKIICNLVMDEMSIRRQIIFNSAAMKYYGYCDFGNPFSDNEEKIEAKEALVFLVNAVNDHFKIPVAYYFVHGLNANEKCNIVQEVLIFLNQADIEISSLTFDGAPTNISMARQLGACFDANNITPWFNHPVTNKPVGIFWDICHMLKLIRNTLACHKEFYDSEGRSIKWAYFEELERLQSIEGVLLANKLKKQHIQFEGQKMKTSLAAQTFSHSVAAAMEYLLRSGNAAFIGCLHIYTHNN